jgi:hypothetical protein
MNVQEKIDLQLPSEHLLLAYGIDSQTAIDLVKKGVMPESVAGKTEQELIGIGLQSDLAKKIKGRPPRSRQTRCSGFFRSHGESAAYVELVGRAFTFIILRNGTRVIATMRRILRCCA